MLENEDGRVIRGNGSYGEFDRLLDEIIRAEEEITSEIRFFTQRLTATEARIHKSIEELIQLINDNGAKHKAM